MNCVNCGAALRLEPGREYLICDACKSIRQMEPNADGVVELGVATDLVCPVCGERLMEAAIQGERVVHCGKCRGTLVVTDTFLHLVGLLREKWAGVEAVPRPMDEKELSRVVMCPRCGRQMDTHPYAGPGNIVIDNCPDCAVNWVDYRELRRIATAGDHSPNPDAWKAL